MAMLYRYEYKLTRDFIVFKLNRKIKKERAEASSFSTLRATLRFVLIK